MATSLRPELLAQILKLSEVSIQDLHDMVQKSSDGGTIGLQISFPVADLLSCLQGNQQANEQEADSTSSNQTVRESRSRAIDLSYISDAGPSEPPNEIRTARTVVPGCDSSYVFHPQSIKSPQMDIVGNKIFIPENKALVQLKAEIVVSGNQAQVVDTSGAPHRLNGTLETVHSPSQNSALPSLIQDTELPDYITQEMLDTVHGSTGGGCEDTTGNMHNPPNTVLGLDIFPLPGSSLAPRTPATSTTNPGGVNPEEDAFKRLGSFLKSQYVPKYFERFLESVSTVLLKGQENINNIPWTYISLAIAIVVFCITKRWITKSQLMTLTSALGAGQCILELLREYGVTEARPSQMA
ncbi:hypothetical protein TWF730_002475 [Orbilia blumenaviensis]|uniref:Uncharacterized protein n=1 Tax=Orbilia blumenaviensis TaxID=1796055 RepID=A0AAV9UAT7_9PEZI